METFTITIDRFKTMIGEIVLNLTPEKLERFYLKLILTNRYSRAILDKGRFRHFDSLLRKYLISLKGGFDAYLTYENKRVTLYLKHRRYSGLHLLAVTQEWNRKNDVQTNHINIPNTSNTDLVYECLRLDINKNLLKVYIYNPVLDDNMVKTNIDWKVARILNQLIK